MHVPLFIVRLTPRLNLYLLDFVCCDIFKVKTVHDGLRDAEGRVVVVGLNCEWIGRGINAFYGHRRIRPTVDHVIVKPGHVVLVFVVISGTSIRGCRLLSFLHCRNFQWCAFECTFGLVESLQFFCARKLGNEHTLFLQVRYCQQQYDYVFAVGVPGVASSAFALCPFYLAVGA